MRISTSKEFRARVDALYRQNMQRWDKAHPLPLPPSAKQVANEIEAGKATVVAVKLAEALREYGEETFDRTSLFDCLDTPSLARLRDARTAREAQRATFQSELDREKDNLLDRVIFDGDAPYPLLRAFAAWKDSRERVEEPFDGK